MSIQVRSSVRSGGRSPAGIVGLAAAFVAGILVAMLLVPDHGRVVKVGASGPSGLSAPAAGDGSPDAIAASGGPGSSALAGGKAGPGAGPAGGVGGAATNGGGPAAAGPAASSGQSSGPGVTANTITIGFGLPDLSAIAALGPGYNQGNPQVHVDSILKELRAEGRLPVNGRDIQPLYSSYNILSADAQRATCEAFGSAKVFAVVAIHDFGPGNECTAREFHLPTFTSDGNTEPVYARSAPDLFTLQMSLNRLLRNFVAWAGQSGFLRGKKVGVYYASDVESTQLVADSLLKPLAAQNAQVVAKVTTDQPSTGGPTDAVAVQKFSSSGVQVAILLVSAIAKTNFFNQAQTQGYKPLYLENDLGFSTTDTATSTYPAAYFSGTPAFTGLHFGENNAGIPENPQAIWCRMAIKKQSGDDIPRSGKDAEYIAANEACDEIMTVMHGLEAAGPSLTRASFIQGIETIHDQPAGIHGNLTFTPQNHDGTIDWRRLDWTQDCKCWRAKGSMAPLLVP